MVLQCGRPGFDPWIGKIPWRRERLLTPVFWPGEFRGLYNPWACKKSDTLSNFHFHLHLAHSGCSTNCAQLKKDTHNHSIWLFPLFQVSSLVGHFVISKWNQLIQYSIMWMWIYNQINPERLYQSYVGISKFQIGKRYKNSIHYLCLIDLQGHNQDSTWIACRTSS